MAILAILETVNAIHPGIAAATAANATVGDVLLRHLPVAPDPISAVTDRLVRS